jgi:iron-sulfur cluster assembly accessory protein
MITITKEASDCLKEFLRKQESETFCRFDVKLAVEKTGCSGNKFVLKPITIREVCECSYLASDCHGIHIWIDPEDKPLVKDCLIDLEKDLLGNKIKITNDSIPNLKVCGCGESFTF